MTRFLIFFTFFHFATASAENPQRLPAYKISSDEITISGISSGAYMAVQMQIAYSSVFSGSASFAGGIYWCAQGDSNRARKECMAQPNGIQVPFHIQYAEKSAQTLKIDPLENLKRHKVYVFSSAKDYIINSGNSEKLVEFYGHFIPNSQIVHETSIPAAHGFPTQSAGGPCGIGMLPWILNCGFDGAAAALQTFYGPLQAKGTAKPENLILFQQQEFGGEDAVLYPSGWVYVPDACAQGESCRLHVALHGCQMNPDFIQDQFARQAGFNDWAETNRTIVLYPQSRKLPTTNPYACWDWFGITGSEYATKQGPQIKAVKLMVDRLRGF